jgi:hypothetical protein
MIARALKCHGLRRYEFRRKPMSFTKNAPKMAGAPQAEEFPRDR